MYLTSKKILGVWDMTKAAPRLGSLIIFLEELLLFRDITKSEKIDIAFIKESNQVDKTKFDHSLLDTVTSFLPNLGAIFFFDSQNSYNEFLSCKEQTYDIWPPCYYSLDETSYADSMISIQKKFREIGKLILLSISEDRKQYVLNWLQKAVPKKLPVVVHLKNNNIGTKSNANVDEWLSFFNTCHHEQLPVHFILIGNDPYGPRYQQCPNVSLAQADQGGLLFDLSMIQACFMFMGMASGPCNMALFSGVPYLIWKHPDHHVQEMDREFQGHSQFLFANEYQKFMREWDSADSLIREFKALYARLNKQQWVTSMYEDIHHDTVVS